MFNQLADQIMFLADNPWLMFGVFFIAATANLFFPPMPLESATLIAGYLSGLGHGSLTVIVTATVSGMFLGSMLLYLLAKKYGTSLLERPPFNKLFTENSYHKVNGWFDKYGMWTVYIGKIIPGMSFCSVLGCGLLGLRVPTAAIAFFGSNLIFFTTLALLGRFLGSQWGKVLAWLSGVNRVGLIVVGIVLGVLLISWLFKKLAKRVKRKSAT